MNWDDNKGEIIAVAAVTAVAVIIPVAWGQYWPHCPQFMPWQRFDLCKWAPLIAAYLIVVVFTSLFAIILAEDRPVIRWVCGALVVICLLALLVLAVRVQFSTP